MPRRKRFLGVEENENILVSRKQNKITVSTKTEEAD